MSESWRPIPGFSDYDVSDLGRVRRARSVFTRVKAGWVLPRLLKPHVGKRGYPVVCLRPDREKTFRSRPVHVLVLAAFVGERPGPEYEGAHSNGNREDNRLSNLRWATYHENRADMVRHGSIAKDRNPNAISRQLASDIRKADGMGVEVAQRFGVAPSTVSLIRNNAHWSNRNE